MDNIFPKMIGFETQTSFMQKRTLLEFVMIKYVIEGTRNIPLEKILTDSNITTGYNSNIGYLLQAISQNNVVFLAHQELYNQNMINSTTHLDVILECNPFFIEKWISIAENKNNVYSFEHTSSSIREMMIGELLLSDSMLVK